MKYNDNGTIKEINVKASDTLPVGTIVDYDGTEVPSGWELVEEVIDFTDKVTFNENYAKALFLKHGKIVTIMYQGEGKAHNNDDVIMKIPTEYLPYFKHYNQYFIPSNVGMTQSINIEIQTNGNVLFHGNYSEDRIYFQCAYITG